MINIQYITYIITFVLYSYKKCFQHCSLPKVIILHNGLVHLDKSK